MIAQNTEIRPESIVYSFDDRHRQPELAVATHGLVKYDEVVCSGAEPVVAVDGAHGVSSRRGGHHDADPHQVVAATDGHRPGGRPRAVGDLDRHGAGYYPV